MLYIRLGKLEWRIISLKTLSASYRILPIFLLKNLVSLHSYFFTFMSILKSQYVFLYVLVTRAFRSFFTKQNRTPYLENTSVRKVSD